MPIYNNLPIIGPFLRSNSRVDAFNPADQKALYQQYREHIGLTKDSTYSAEAFNKLDELRRQDFGGFFKGTKDPKDDKAPPKLTAQEENVKTKLSVDTPDTQKVKAAITTALQKTPAFTEAQTAYTESVGTFKELIKGIPEKYKSQDVISVLAELRSEAKTAIQAQHTKEKQALENQLKDPDVNNALVAAFAGSQAEADKAKDSLKKDLEKGHKLQLDFFEKSTGKAQEQLHKAAAKDMDRILFLANLHKNSAENRALIEAEMVKLREAANPGVQGQAVIGMDDKGVYLSQVSLESLPTIKSLTGKEIQRQSDGSYKVEMSRHIFDPLYYNDPRQNVTTDMVTLAQAVRASGHDKIKMSVNFEDPEIADERAQQAFEACIKAGYKIEDISIEKNGQLIKGEDVSKELFKNDPKKYAALAKQSQDIGTQLEKVREIAKKQLSSPSTQGQAEVKKEITAIKDRAAAAAAAANPAPASGPSGP